MASLSANVVNDSDEDANGVSLATNVMVCAAEGHQVTVRGVSGRNNAANDELAAGAFDWYREAQCGWRNPDSELPDDRMRGDGSAAHRAPASIWAQSPLRQVAKESSSVRRAQRLASGDLVARLSARRADSG